MAYHIGKGFVLTIASTTIGQVVSADGPNMSYGTVETTHMGSTEREFLGTIQDSGDAEFTVNWDPDTAGSINHPTLLSTFTAGAIVVIKQDFAGPTLDVFTISGILTSFRVLPRTVDSVLQVSVGVKYTGAHALAAT